MSTKAQKRMNDDKRCPSCNGGTAPIRKFEETDEFGNTTKYAVRYCGKCQKDFTVVI